MDNPVIYEKKKTVYYFFDEKVGSFDYGENHFMQPKRINMTDNLIEAYGLKDKMEICATTKASFDEMIAEGAHDKEYIEFLKNIKPDDVTDKAKDLMTKFKVGSFHDNTNNRISDSKEPGMEPIPDCPVFAGMYEFSQIVAGCSLEAARKLNEERSGIAINWSGGLHHAKKAAASGFCYVNDIVIAINELLKVYKRVLYIDIDIHHGDGVQEAFYTTNKVFTVSFHKYAKKFFPETGKKTDIGEGDGKYYCLNVPLPDATSDCSYVEAFTFTIRNVNKKYKPEAIVMQCGADSLNDDPLGGYNLTVKGHGQCVKVVKKLKLPLLLLGGGGYKPENAARCWAYETSVALGEEINDERKLKKDKLKIQYWKQEEIQDFKLHTKASMKMDQCEVIERTNHVCLNLKHMVDRASNCIKSDSDDKDNNEPDEDQAVLNMSTTEGDHSDSKTEGEAGSRSEQSSDDEALATADMSWQEN